MKPFFIAFGGAISLSLLEADTLRIVELSDLGARGNDEERMVSRSPWSEEAYILYPGIRGGGILEAYVVPPGDEGNGMIPQDKLRVALRLKDDQKVEGFVDFLAAFPEKKLEPRAFEFDPAKFPEASEEDFAAIRKAHDVRMARSGLPGTVWYRHRAGVLPPENRWSANRDFDDTFRMATGGRALAENLALDRDLILASGEKGEAVDLTTLQGIKVPAIDWTGKLKPGEVAVDALALLVPEDQHLLLLPSFTALFELRDVMDKEGAPILQTYDVRSPYHGLAARYQEQMGIGELEALVRTLGIGGSVAVTGGDPFFATGTDVALIFETGKPGILFDALAAALKLRALREGVEAKEEDGIRGYQTADRSFSVYLTRFEGAVAISNSLVQAKRIAAVAKKELPALGTTDEYRFFRQRYPKDAEEDGYLFLSDATIRRWCGPEVRIAASRRTRAAAALGELVAAKLDGSDPAGDYQELLGQVSEDGGVPRSEIYQTLKFLTPVAELEIQKVTPAEAHAYTRWKDGYERGWRRVFDPIAIRLKMDGAKRQLDLSVMPLTVDSRYRSWMDLTGRKKLERGAQASHAGAKAFFSFAVDRESQLFKDLGEQSLEILPSLKANALGWVGDSVSVYLDDTFFWRALSVGDAENLLQMNYLRLPLGVRIESRSSLQLAAFLAALRGYIEESAPDLLEWRLRKHGEVSYVVVVSKEEEQTPMSAAVYYAALKNALLISLDEKVLLNAIEREKQKPAAGGEHVRIEADSDIPVLLGLSGGNLLERQRLESWAALPILNEWRRRDPSKDPVKAYAAAFQENIRCPGGKGYRWNEAAGTMESVVFGFPADPRGEEVKWAAGELRLRAGIRFEDDGLRLEASMEPVSALPKDAKEEAEGEAIEVPAGFPSLKDLVPLTEGLELTYHVDETDAEGPYKKVRKTLASTVQENGTLVRVEEKIDAEGEEDDFVSTYEQLLSEEGYHLLSVKREDGARVYGKAMPLLPPRLAPGVLYGGDYDSEATTEDEVILVKDAGAMRARVIGLEKVEVPAGVFENCVRIDGEYDYLAGVEIGRVTESIWWAPEVGIVKSIWKTEFGHGTEVLEKLAKP